MSDEWISSLLHGGALGACVAVLAACICRLDMLKLKRSKFSSIGAYLLLAVYTGGVMTDLCISRPIDWYEYWGVGGLLLLVFQNRKRWRHGPPRETDRMPLDAMETRP